MSSKKLKSTNTKLNEANDSQSKTYIDSIYNSKNCLNKGNKYINSSILNLMKESNKKDNNNLISNRKQKNFYNALKILNKENENTENIKSALGSTNSSKFSKNIISLLSEFSSTNIDKSKDYNVSKYLHHPITKQIIKLGNQIIKKRNTQAYRVSNGLEIDKPFVSDYNMANIFEQFNHSFIEVENSNNDSNSQNNNNKNIDKNKIYDKEINFLKDCMIKNKKIKYFHKKNKSSITNYYFNDNNSTSTIVNCNNKSKNNRYVIHYKYNISSQIGQNKINYKDKESNTTVTKDDYLKEFLQINEVNDINININIFNNNRNLEIINDFDETKENNMFSTNKKKETESNNKNMIIKNEISKNIFIDDKKVKTSTESKENDYDIKLNSDEILKSIELSKEKYNLNVNNKLKTLNKFNNYSMNKTLRKKYERTEFKFKYINDNIFGHNSYIMRNLMNKFEQCSDIDIIKDIKKINKTKESKSNSIITNKNNETFVIKDLDFDGPILNLDVSFNNNSLNKNNNTEDNDISTVLANNLEDKISKIAQNNIIKSIKAKISLNNIYTNKTNKNKSIDKITSNLSSNLNINDSLKIVQRLNTYPFILKTRNNYCSPDSKNGLKMHPFNLDLPFIQNNLNASNNINFLLTKSIHSINKNPKPLPQSIYDYTFYQKLLKADENMEKNCKIFTKKSSILNTEIRLEILLYMMKTCEEFAFKRDTYHNSCYYFDKYLTLINKKVTNKSELELIAITCIVIGAKLEEIQLPRLKEYAELLNGFGVNDIIETEKKICSKLSWRLIVMTKNIWLSWYICQWDLFIDTIDNIKARLLNILNEDDILYYKKPNGNSYYNFRKISQLIDIMTLDFDSYKIEPRVLIASAFFILLCINYKLKYNFLKKKFENNTSLSKLLFVLFEKFITQSFDYDFYEDRVQRGIKYCYKYINFPFIFDLPLLYQVHQNKLDGDSYEDFLSYQTTNDNYYKIIKKKIKVNKNQKHKSIKKFSGNNNNFSGKIKSKLNK